MIVNLVVEQGARRRAMTIRSEEAILGRGRGNTVRIPSAEVSRQHCRLQMEDGLVRVEDLGSVNGTFVNGRKIRKPEYLRPGDQLEVGPVKFTVEYDLTSQALDRLREEENPGDLMELLADGDVILEMGADEELPMLEALEDEEVPLLEALEDDLSALDPGSAEDVLVPEMEVDDAGGWQIPEGGDFRDMLSQLKDDPRKPKRRQ